MKCLNKCGDVVIRTDFVLGNAKHIEIKCFFCTDSFKSLESFAGHLRDIHSWLLQALSDYYLDADKEYSSNTGSNYSNVENYFKNRSTELPWTEMMTCAIKITTEISEHDSEPYTEHGSEPHTEHDSKKNPSHTNIRTQNVDEYQEISTDNEESMDRDGHRQSSGSEYEPNRTNTKRLGKKKICQVTHVSSFTSKSAENKVVIELIAEMEKYPELWMYRFIGDRKRIQREKAMNEIYNHLKETFPSETFSERFVVRTVGSLRRNFHRSEIGEIPISLVPYYKELSFLKNKTRRVPEKIEIAVNPAGRFQCPHCPKDYMSEGAAKKHIRSHCFDSRFKCEICGKQYFFRNELRVHMLVHTNEKPLICEICGRRFRISNQLRVHLNVHRKQKNYKCELCPKAYYRRVFLNDHMNTHYNLKPAVCDTCGKGFSSKVLLAVHVKIHSGDLKYKCTLCDKAFAQASRRATHMRRDHKVL